MMSLTLRKLVITALILLVASHLLTIHVVHLQETHNNVGSRGSHQSFQTHPHYDIPVDLGSQVLLAGERCPVAVVAGQRIEPKLYLPIACQSVEPLLRALASVPTEPPAIGDVPLPPGPDRQAVLQRFTL